MHLSACSKRWLAVGLIITISVTFIVYFCFNPINRSENKVFWKQESVFGLDNFGTATYKDGILYAPSKGNNKVYAINSSNNHIIWSSIVRQCDGSPCIDGNIIYVGECVGPNGEPTYHPRAIALNKTTGEEIWHFIEPNNTAWVGSPLFNGDYVYYTTIGTGVYALNKSNGKPVWHQNIGKVVCSVAYDDGVIFVSAYDPPGQYALNATTGEYVWHVNYGASWDSSPVVYRGMIIQVAQNTTTELMSTYVLNETNGKLIREFEGKGGQSTPLVHNDKLFIPNYNCVISAFNLTTGTELWHTSTLTIGTPNLYHPNLSYCSPALANGTIYFQSLSGTFYMISEADGTIQWSLALGGYGFGSPSIGDSHVFITNDSALYAFNINFCISDWPMFCRNNLHQSYVD